MQVVISSDPLEIGGSEKCDNNQTKDLEKGPRHVFKGHHRRAAVQEWDTSFVINRRQKEMNSAKDEHRSALSSTRRGLLDLSRPTMAMIKFTSLRKSRADTLDHWPFLWRGQRKHFDMLHSKQRQQATNTRLQKWPNYGHWVFGLLLRCLLLLLSHEPNVLYRIDWPTSCINDNNGNNEVGRPKTTLSAVR